MTQNIKHHLALTTTKICNLCGKDLPLSEYSVLIKSIDGLHPVCKACRANVRTREAVGDELSLPAAKWVELCQNRLTVITRGLYNAGVLDPEYRDSRSIPDALGMSWRRFQERMQDQFDETPDATHLAYIEPLVPTPRKRALRVQLSQYGNIRWATGPLPEWMVL